MSFSHSLAVAVALNRCVSVCLFLSAADNSSLSPLCVYLSVCLSVSVCLCLSVCLSVSLSLSSPHPLCSSVHFETENSATGKEAEMKSEQSRSQLMDLKSDTDAGH